MFTLPPQDPSSQSPGNSARALPRAWESPRLTYVGHVADILQVGVAKLSADTADPGEPRKVGVQG